MINKVIISVLAAAEVLTLFPLIFFGVARTIDSVELVENKAHIYIMFFAVIYMFTVLICGYQAISQREKPTRAYLILTIPLLLLGIGFILRNTIS